MHSGAAIRSRRSYGAKARSYAAVNERVMFIAYPNNGCHGISNVSAEQREQIVAPLISLPRVRQFLWRYFRIHICLRKRLCEPFVHNTDLHAANAAVQHT